MGPVFRLGSFYLDTDDKIRWHKMTDYERLADLCSMRYPYLGLELALLALISVYLMYLSFDVMQSRVQLAAEHYLIIPSWSGNLRF